MCIVYYLEEINYNDRLKTLLCFALQFSISNPNESNTFVYPLAPSKSHLCGCLPSERVLVLRGAAIRYAIFIVKLTKKCMTESGSPKDKHTLGRECACWTSNASHKDDFKHARGRRKVLLSFGF